MREPEITRSLSRSHERRCSIFSAFSNSRLCPVSRFVSVEKETYHTRRVMHASVSIRLITSGLLPRSVYVYIKYVYTLRL